MDECRRHFWIGSALAGLAVLALATGSGGLPAPAGPFGALAAGLFGTMLIGVTGPGRTGIAAALSPLSMAALPNPHTAAGLRPAADEPPPARQRRAQTKARP